MCVFQDIVMSIIRPPRQLYRIGKLGPSNFTIRAKNIPGVDFHLKRQDSAILNSRRHRLVISSYWIQEVQDAPVVIYMHTNNGSRYQGLEYVRPLAENGIATVLFDCSGSGISGGEFITLGVGESEDLRCVIQYLIERKSVKKVGVWGRSMGAVATLLYAANNPHKQLKVCIYDSPFSNLEQLIREIAKLRTGLPEFVFRIILPTIESKLKDRINLTFEDYRIEKRVGQITVPGMFITSQNDKMVNPEHSEQLFDLYGGQKQIQYLVCQHNQPRPSRMLNRCIDFMKLHLDLRKPYSISLTNVKPKQYSEQSTKLDTERTRFTNEESIDQRSSAYYNDQCFINNLCSNNGSNTPNNATTAFGMSHFKKELRESRLQSPLLLMSSKHPAYTSRPKLNSVYQAKQQVGSLAATHSMKDLNLQLGKNNLNNTRSTSNLHGNLIGYRPSLPQPKVPQQQSVSSARMPYEKSYQNVYRR